MKQFSPIVLTGFMASGKTSVASALSRLVGWPMIDLDGFICDREQRSIRAIVEQDGEAFFRERESCALQKVIMNPRNSVIALGGGTWILERNRRLIMQRRCLTAWLDAPFELCWERIKRDGRSDGVPGRPLAQSRDHAYRLYKDRLPYYRLSELHLRTDEDKTADELASEIIRRTRKISPLPILQTPGETV